MYSDAYTDAHTQNYRIQHAQITQNLTRTDWFVFALDSVTCAACQYFAESLQWWCVIKYLYAVYPNLAFAITLNR